MEEVDLLGFPPKASDLLLDLNLAPPTSIQHHYSEEKQRSQSFAVTDLDFGVLENRSTSNGCVSNGSKPSSFSEFQGAKPSSELQKPSSFSEFQGASSFDFKSKQDTSSDEDDDVFHATWSSQPKKERDREGKVPLLPSSTRSKRRQGSRLHSILKSEGKGLTEKFNPSDDDEATVRSVKSWRSRLICGLLFLAGNAVLAIGVGVIIYYTDLEWIFKPTLPAPTGKLCEKMEAVYVGNFTPHIKRFYMVPSPRTIKRKKDWLILVPYGSYCDESGVCPSGVFAVYGEEMKTAWRYQAKSFGDISSFSCGTDLDGDDVQDCALVFDPPYGMIELFSGSDGLPIKKTDDSDIDWKFWPPVWVTDSNADMVPELLITRMNPELEILELSMWRSEKKSSSSVVYGSILLLSISRVAAASAAVIWKSGDGKQDVILRAVDQNGLRLWPLPSLFLNQASLRERKLFEKWKLGLSFFADVNGDGETELVCCEGGGGLLALKKSAPDPLWVFTLTGFLCVSDSISFLRNGTSLRVIAFFESQKTSKSFKMAIVDGKSGTLIEESMLSKGTPLSWAPLSVAMSNTPDLFVSWSHLGDTLNLIGGHSAKDATNLLQSEHLPQGNDHDAVTKRLEEMSTATFFAQNRSINVFISTNLFVEEDEADMKVMLHKINATCSCSGGNCGNIPEQQPWSAYLGARGDSTYP